MAESVARGQLCSTLGGPEPASLVSRPQLRLLKGAGGLGEAPGGHAGWLTDTLALRPTPLAGRLPASRKEFLLTLVGLSGGACGVGAWSGHRVVSGLRALWVGTGWQRGAGAGAQPAAGTYRRQPQGVHLVPPGPGEAGQPRRASVQAGSPRAGQSPLCRHRAADPLCCCPAAAAAAAPTCRSCSDDDAEVAGLELEQEGNPYTQPLGPCLPSDTPRTICIKQNLERVSGACRACTARGAGRD